MLLSCRARLDRASPFKLFYNLYLICKTLCVCDKGENMFRMRIAFLFVVLLMAACGDDPASVNESISKIQEPNLNLKLSPILRFLKCVAMTRLL